MITSIKQGEVNAGELEILLVPFSAAWALENSIVDIRWTVARGKRSSGDRLDEYVKIWGQVLLSTYRDAFANGDRVRQVKDGLWERTKGGVHDLLGRFLELADELLEVRGGVPCPSPSVLDLSATCLLVARIDPTLLRAAWYARQGLGPQDVGEKHFRSAAEHQPFDRLLTDVHGGLAETHLHVNSAMTSEIAWCCTVADVKTTLPRPEQFSAKTFVEGGGAGTNTRSANRKGLVPWLWWARITRVLLQRFMRDAESGTAFLDWSQAYLLGVLDGRAFSSDLAQRIVTAWRGALMGETEAWWDVEESQIEDVQHCCSDGAGRVEADPPALLLEGILMEERRLTVGALALAWQRRHPVPAKSSRGGSRTRLHSPDDWDRAVLQYLRIRNLYHRHLTVYERDSGFEEFYDVFRRGSPVAKRLLASDRRALATAFAHLDPLHQISRVEFRHPTRTEDPHNVDLGDCLYSIEAIEQRLRGVEAFEEETNGMTRQAGLVFHFNKKTKVGPGGVQLKRWTHNIVDGKWRLGYEFAALLEEAKSLASLWCAPPLHYWVVGFDTAGVETLLPNWPFLAILRKLRHTVKREIAKRPTEPTPGVTFHAGECFYLVLAGLHRIGQVIEFLGEKDSAGGRIGHALALDSRQASLHATDGECNESWAMAICWAYQQLGEHSDWLGRNLKEVVRQVRAAANPRSNTSTPKWMKDANQELDADQLSEAYRRFGDPTALVHIGFPFSSPPHRGPDGYAERLAATLLYSSSYNLWAQRAEMHEDAPDEVLDSLRIALCRQVREMRGKSIVIEACPSSNLAVGNRLGAHTGSMAGYETHPAVGLYCLPDNQPPWGVSINTDNPLTFAINLREEYRRMYCAGVPEDWLVARRRDADNSCFLPQPGARPAYRDLWKRLRQLSADPDFRADLEARNLDGWWKCPI